MVKKNRQSWYQQGYQLYDMHHFILFQIPGIWNRDALSNIHTSKDRGAKRLLLQRVAVEV